MEEYSEPTKGKIYYKHRIFVEEFLSNGFKNVHAYLKAYPNTSYESAAPSATRLLNLPHIKKYLEDRLKERQLSTNQLLDILQQFALGDSGDYVEIIEEGESVRLSLLDENGERKPTRNIKKLKIVKKRLADGESETQTEFELEDRQAAIDKLLRVQGVYKDSLDLNVKTYKIDIDFGNEEEDAD